MQFEVFLWIFLLGVTRIYFYDSYVLHLQNGVYCEGFSIGSGSSKHGPYFRCIALPVSLDSGEGKLATGDGRQIGQCNWVDRYALQTST